MPIRSRITFSRFDPTKYPTLVAHFSPWSAPLFIVAQNTFGGFVLRLWWLVILVLVLYTYYAYVQALL